MALLSRDALELSVWLRDSLHMNFGFFVWALAEIGVQDGALAVLFVKLLLN